MKPNLLFLLLMVLKFATTANFSNAQSPVKLGQAAEFGILAGAVAKTSTPVYVYGLYGGLSGTDPLFNGTKKAPAAANDIKNALSDLTQAQAQCASLASISIKTNLSGAFLKPGVYQTNGDTWIDPNATLTLKGNFESYFVFNVIGAMTFDKNAVVRLDGVLANHVFWNVQGDISFADNCTAAGLFLGTKSIATTGFQYGGRQLLAQNNVVLTGLSSVFGTNSFYSASVLAGTLALGCTAPTLAACDNQVVNGDFENYRQCPLGINNFGPTPAVSDGCNFYQAGNGTPDYFNACATVASGASLPQNFFTMQTRGRTARSGTGYAGATSSTATALSSIREYVGQMLPIPLQAGQYYGEFWVSLASLSRLSARQLGMHVSAARLNPPINPQTPGIPLTTPTISGTPGTFPNTTDTNWYRISGVFNAAGNEQFITLGCFLPDGNGTANFGNGIYPTSGNGGHPGAYYFYDDISIVRMPTAGANVSTSCYVPVTIGQGCTPPASVGPVTYQWTPTTGLANPTQLITQASPDVTTTYTLTTFIGGTSATSSVTVTVTDGIPANATVLGSPNTTTTLSGSQSYSGNFVIQGDLLLTSGTFTLNPGTTFYFNNPPVSGEPVGKIIVGNNATLRISNATVRGTCNSWFGIVLSQNQYANSHLTIEDGSLIANAKYGVYGEPYDHVSTPLYDTQYSITDSQFQNNWTHVYDASQHSALASSCTIADCSFTSNAQQMLPPYNSNGPGSYNSQITYQALYINPYTFGGVYPDPSTPANSGSVNVSSNVISNAVYGILNHEQDRGFVNITNNLLLDIYTIGIWKAANPGYDVGGNTIRLSGSKSVNTVQISPNNPVIGIAAGAFSILGGVRVNSNAVTGDNAQNQTDYKEQIGIVAPYQEVAVQENTLATLSAGVTYRDPNINLFSNRFTNCLAGLKIIPYNQAYSNYLNGPPRVECNTFERTSGFTATTYGIWAPPQIPSGGTNDPVRDAYLPDMGTSARPCGNAFVNMSVAVRNEGNNAGTVYHRFDTNQEPVVRGAQLSVSTGAAPRANECRIRSATPFSPNGVNRQANPLAYVQSLMDSVRLQLVPTGRQGAYQGQIIRYFAAQADLPALERYATTLPLANREARYAFNLYLLRTYAAQHQPQAAQRAGQQLLALASGNNDVRQEVALLETLAHADRWLPAGHRLPAPDSAALANAAASGTTVAEQAATWLRYYYPHAAPYREPRQQLAAASAPAAATAQPLPAETELYPNPATATATARYRMVRLGQTVELQVFSLLTSRQVLLERLPATTGLAAYQERAIDLRALPAGQYSYRFVVDGKAQAAHHFVIH